MAKKFINCTQINLHHAHTATDNFNLRFESNDIHITLLSEPRHINDKIVGIKGGKLIYTNIETPGGNTSTPRAAILIKKEIPFLPLNDFITPDLVAIEIKINKEGINLNTVVASGYHPRDRGAVPQKLRELIEYCKKTGKQLIYGCDSNAHHSAWGSKGYDNRGYGILDFINVSDLTILNLPGKHTYDCIKNFRAGPARVQDSIDLTLATDLIARKITDWEVSDDYSFSDHKYIDFKITDALIEPIKFRNPRSTNWKRYRELLGKNN